jgi:N-formylmaleamate deformylase
MPRLFYGSVKQDGIRLQYYRTGGDKPALVFLHGLTDNGLCWGQTALYLEPDFDVVMVDAPAHGLSDAPENGYSTDEQAIGIARLIEELQLDRPVLVGHSIGASIAAVVAVDHPSLVRGVVLEDPPWTEFHLNEDNTARQERASRLADHIENLRVKSHEELVELGRKNHPAWNAADVELWARAKQQVRPAAARVISTPRRPWTQISVTISVPVLLITANQELGGLVTPETESGLSKKWKHSKVVNIPTAGHNIRRESFELYFKEVREFLTRRINWKK